MNTVFWIVTCSIKGHSYDFVFDSRYAADDFSKLMNGSIRKYSPRNVNTLSIASNNAYWTKRWLQEKGFDFWPAPKYPELTDDDDDLPF